MLINNEARRKLIDLLLRLPGIGTPEDIRSLLTDAGIPTQWQVRINSQGSLSVVINNLVDVLEGYGLLSDGSHPIIRLIEAAMDRVSGFELEAELRALRDELVDQLNVDREIIKPGLKAEGVEKNATELVQALVEGRLKSEAVQERAIADIPVQRLDKDKLGFGVYVRALRDFIASQETSTPLTIGIYGTWGSGKSSLMRMVKNELDPPLTFWSSLWLKRLWWRWFCSYLRTWLPWRYGRFLLWIDDKRGSRAKLRDAYIGRLDATDTNVAVDSSPGSQPSLASTSKGSAASNNHNSRPNKISMGIGTFAHDSQNNLLDASVNASNGNNSQKNQLQDLFTLNKIGGPKRFQQIREGLPYTLPTPEEALSIAKKNLPPLEVDNFKKMLPIELQKIRAGLSYDPSTTDIKLNDLNDSVEQEWAQVASAHCPMIPLTHPTIWFNAWKFDQEEQLWAALALEVMEQIKQKYSYLGRFLFWLRLTFMRLSFLAATLSIIKKWFLPLLLASIAVIYTLYITKMTNTNAFPHGYEYLQPFSPQGLFGQYIPYILVIGAILSGLSQAVNIIKDPFQISVKDVLDKPNYKDKVGFIGSFEDDFARIVSLATRARFGWKPQKLVIFIDDLDRCEPPKAADIIEGINLFLDSERCVFVLGMDPAAVAASIENKYKELFEKIRRENMDVVSPGKLFLDKIIQVPFHVPQSSGTSITQLITDIMQPKPSLLNSGPVQQPQNISQGKNAAGSGEVATTSVPAPESTSVPGSTPTTFDYRFEHIQTAIEKGAEFLPENPRQVKKYINLFRFYVYIAGERGLLRFREEGVGKRLVGLDINRLAIWVAWSVRWSEIAKPLSEEVQTAEVRDYLWLISKVLKQDGSWCSITEAVKEEPGLGNLTLFPMEDYELSKYPDPVYAKLIKRISQIRETKPNAPSHWSYLPWEWWLLNPVFRKGLKEMESFWKPTQKGEDDWLLTVLTLTRYVGPERQDSLRATIE